jgi:putative flavoprotein involved in K+ transport
LRHILDGIDAFVEANGFASEVLEANRPKPFQAPATPTRLDLVHTGISTVVWATGYRRSYPWLNVPVLDADGEIEQRCGVTAVPGIYTVGQRFQTRRSSSFISGVGHDAAAVAAHIQALRPVMRRSTILSTDLR